MCDVAEVYKGGLERVLCGHLALRQTHVLRLSSVAVQLVDEVTDDTCSYNQIPMSNGHDMT